jgi:predicted ester cyclase
MVDSGEGPKVGTPAIAAATHPLWDAFALQGEPRMILASGDHALTISLLRGTQEKVFNGLPPTGKTFGVFVAEVMQLDDQGRHQVVRNYVDLAGMAASLGGGAKGQAFRKPYELTGRPAHQVIGAGGDAEAANVAAVQAGFDKFNAKDWKGVAGIYTSDAAIYEQIAAEDTEGARAIGKYYAETGKAFSDAQEKVESIWSAGDFVVVESTFTGTNDGPLPRMGLKKATKKPVTLHQAHVFRLDGGKVLQHWIFSNGLAIGLQLGLITPPAPPAAKG